MGQPARVDVEAPVPTKPTLRTRDTVGLRDALLARKAQKLQATRLGFLFLYMTILFGVWILALRHKLLEGTDGAEKLEEDIKENDSFAKASRKTKGDEIGVLDEQLSAVRAVLQIFSGFNDTCGVLATEVLGAHEARCNVGAR